MDISAGIAGKERNFMKNVKGNTEKKLFGFEGGFYTYTGKIFDLIVVSIYWLLGCLPVITIGASFCALYAAVEKSVRQDRGSISGQFWHAYRRNLLPSIPLTLIYGGVMFVMLLNIGILGAETDSLWGLFFMVLYALTFVFFLVSACYAFPALSRFDMPAGWFVKLSFYMTVRHLPVSLLLLALFAVSYLALLNQPALFLLVPGVVSCLSSVLLEPLLDLYMPREEEKAER